MLSAFQVERRLFAGKLRIMQTPDPSELIPAGKSAPRKRLVVLLVLAFVAVQVGYLVWQTLRPQPLKPMADYVIAHGRQQQIIPPLAQQLGIPLANLTCNFLSAKSQSGRVRVLEVRQRPGTRYVDIIFSDVAPGETEAYYYLTSQFGKLINSIHMTTKPQPVENAEERFQKEWDFWQTWQREAIKLDQP